jgi:hypothetical protein
MGSVTDLLLIQGLLKAGLWFNPKQLSNLLCRVRAKIVIAPLNKRFAGGGGGLYSAQFVGFNASQDVASGYPPQFF